MSMQQRRDEILAKKAKLEELRRTRKQRENERSQRQSGLHTPLEASSTPTRAEARQKIDDIVNSLIGQADSGRASRSGSPATRGSRPSSVGGATTLIGADGSSTPGTPSRRAAIYTTSVATQTSGDVEHDGSLAATSTSLGGTGTSPQPPPKPAAVTYSVGVQTTESWATQDDDEDDTSGFANVAVGAEVADSKSQKRMSRRDKELEEELRQNIRREVEEELRAIKDPGSDQVAGGAAAQAQARFPTRPLTDDELNVVTSSDDFLLFLDRSSKVIERALDEEYDVLADYALDGMDGGDDDDDDGYAASSGRKGRRLKELTQFYEERWSKKRMLSDISFSPKFPELVLASYTKNSSAPQDPSGLVQVWNLHLHSRPEYIFHSTSDVLTAKFSPFHPSLVVGGCYSGQVQLWDTRSRSPLPVQKTPLTGASSGGHTHPVYSVDIVGTQNANNIISCSTDGVVCGWTVDMLSQPQEYLELVAPAPSRTEDISPTCIGFPPSDPTSFLIGTEEGTMYPCHRYDRAGAKAGVDSRIRYRGHTAPIMGLNFHSSRGPVDLSDMVLTSSIDWTVCLWKIKPPSSASATATATNSATTLTASLTGQAATNAQDITPVFEISREDIVYDAKWSPQKPSVFALVDGGGSVEVWDLLTDTEIPVTKATPTVAKKVAGLPGAYVPRSLNKVSWDDKDGKRLAVGGASGQLTVFEVGSGLSAESAKPEEWASMKRLVSKLERSTR